AARVVVAHAGVGTILSAKRFGKPLVLLPRRVALGEHRNDHQMATAQAVAPLPGIHIAWEVDDLPPLLATPDLACATDTPSPSHAALMARLKSFIDAR
ncbi:MAG: glycosyltransferase, partial [Pseudomonadota bacterium]